MIGQYLLNKNESATVAKSEILWELNKAGVWSGGGMKFFRAGCERI